ncbi:hypothetical protein N6H14_19495 [Paenibacillus sp. CC-CFT747]|nr:hypothetical protein N6H14_19495 [Paenibacillus sp. CC-CFT747]
MSSTVPKLAGTSGGMRSWSWYKKSLLAIAAAGFLASSFLFLTPPGLTIREKLAETVITTQHRNWAWIFVGAEQRDRMVAQMQQDMEEMGSGHIDTSKIIVPAKRPVGDLIKVEDISGQFWKGKKIYVYDPKSIRVVVPGKVGEGEKSPPWWNEPERWPALTEAVSTTPTASATASPPSALLCPAAICCLPD